MRTVSVLLLLMLATASAVAAAVGTIGVMQPNAGDAAAGAGGFASEASAEVRALGAAAAEAWRAVLAKGGESAVEAGAPILESWILSWRERALADGTEPIPAPIREQLVGYFPDALLETVRYRIGWVDAGPWQPSVFRLLDARAVTLRDVIVFRDGAIAADPVIWAHELTHVRQFERWGTLEFARRYLRDHRAIEAEAWEAAARYRMWTLEAERVARGPAQRY
jgi:hypothetical protein